MRHGRSWGRVPCLRRLQVVPRAPRRSGRARRVCSTPQAITSRTARIAWQRTDGSYFQIRMPKALVGKWDIAGTDKAENEVGDRIEPRLDMAVSGQLIDNPPFVGEYFWSTP